MTLTHNPIDILSSLLYLNDTLTYTYITPFTPQIFLYHQYENQYLDITFPIVLNLAHSSHHLHQYYQQTLGLLHSLI